MREAGWRELLGKLDEFLDEGKLIMAKLIIWNIMSLDGAFEGATPWDLPCTKTSGARS